MGLLSNEFAKREAGAIEIAAEAMRLSWPLTGLTSVDSHTLLGKFSCSLRVGDNPTDRKMFAEVMLRDRPIVTTADLAKQFSEAIAPAADRIARSHSADEWLGNDFHQQMIDAILAALKPVAFACGLELLPPNQLDLSSPTLNQKRQAESARIRAEALSAGRLEHLKHAGEMMTRFQEMRHAAPDLPAGVLLDRVAPADRGAMLQMLLAGSAEQAEPQTLWAVAGQRLFRIDVSTIAQSSQSPRVENIALPSTLGPLRSVQSADVNGEKILLIGARSGIFTLARYSGRGQGEGLDSPSKGAQLADEQSGPHPNPLPEYREREPERPSSDSPTAYTDPLIQSDLGFNTAIAWQGHIVACHGDAGIVGWRIDQPDTPAFRIAPPPNLSPANSSALNTAGRPRKPSARNLQIVDDEFAIYSVGRSLKLLSAPSDSPIDLPTNNSAEIIAILPDTTLADTTSLLIVRDDGSVEILDRATRRITNTLRIGGKICSATALPWLGTTRLLLANDAGPIDLVGVEDSTVLRYTSAHRSLRQLAASPQCIAAVSSDRQRIVLWQPWESTPIREIHISAITGHRIADVEFV